MEGMRTQVTELPAEAETMERSRQAEQAQLVLPSTVQLSQARPAEP
jgi:hypothetical protein